MRERIEYWVVVAVARCLGRLPRALARWWASLLAFKVYWLFGRLRRVGERNLELALPQLSSKTRKTILRRVYVHLGWHLAEFCRMSRYTPENTREWLRTEGLEHFLAAQARGKGVLVITGHLGAWELSSFYHSLMGHPMGVEACTGTGLAHVARKTEAAVLPGFMLWEAAERRYVLRFGPEVEIPRTDDVAGDILEGTARCTREIEAWIRRYPDQWLWIHRRWKTRPAGEPALY